jgi:ribosome-binding ATPase YchF (GTP1/OBG family)
MKVAEGQNCKVAIISAQMEAELNQLDEDEAAEYLADLGVTEGGLQSLVKATYAQLGLRTYFTTGEQETRAWTFNDGMTAPQCAGVIHSDFEKKFIRAETMAYDQFVECNGFPGGKDKGLLRLEGKDYVVQEGDVILFRTGA